MPLRIEISGEATGVLRRLPTKHALQIDGRIQRLATEPFPPGALKLQGTIDVYRVRQAITVDICHIWHTNDS